MGLASKWVTASCGDRLRRVARCTASVLLGTKVLESLPAPSAASTFLARFASTGPGPGCGGTGNMIGLAARNAARLSINCGTYTIGNGQQQVTYSHTSTTALHSGSHLSGKITGCRPSAMERRPAKSQNGLQR